MWEQFWKALKADELSKYRDEVNRENRMAVKFIAISGLPLGLASAVAQAVFLPDPSTPIVSLRSSWIFIYFIFLFILERFFIPKECNHGALLIYAIEAPVLLISILLGSIWDPAHQAMTFFIFLMAMPVFILDRPGRLLCVFACWTILFLLACAAVKPPEILHRDILHAVEFFLASTAVTYVVVRLRRISLQRMGQARYLVEHDELTGARNRKSLERHGDDYVGKPILVVQTELDRLRLFNEFYGNAFGNQMLIEFARLMTESFGKEHTYRNSGDSMLGIAIDIPQQEYKALIDECRAKFRPYEIDGRSVDFSCAFGYVTGTASTVEEFQQMIQLANIHAYKARNSGRGQMVGSIFDEQQLKDGRIESIRRTHARAYETNQLTGLPSMSYFFAQTEELLATVVDLSRRPLIGFLKLEHIKEYNEKYGYAKGDELIKHAAGVLQTAFPQRVACSISGSQFGVMCYLDEVEPGMQAIVDALSQFEAGFPASCKGGFAEYAGSDSVIALLDKARIAHANLKKGNENHGDMLYRLYDEKLDEEIRFRRYIVSHLDEAIEKGYLEVHYQPIIRSVTGKICNEEALSRWNDPVHGFLPPFRFIPPLEEERQIYKLSLHVVRQILKDFKRKQELGVPIVPVSVNLSRHDFEQCDMVQEISSIVDASGFSRDLIVIEITESAFIKNQELLKREVQRFRQSGFQVWMDDFGSEYSTLNLLQELDFDLIKIDMQFMKNFSQSNRNLIIVSDIIDMAKRMGIITLIEGIETDEHYHALRAMGCNKLQGFFFDRPNDFDSVLRKHRECTRFSYEETKEAPYYTAIGRINLNAPFASSALDDRMELSGQLPVAIVEQTAEGFSCLLGSDRFNQIMLNNNATTNSDVESPVAVPPESMPAELRNAIADCVKTEGWVSVELTDDANRSTNVYLRVISRNEISGNVAFLFVLLSANKVF